MFDIGFLEILIVLIIALLVIGPERMPEVARKLGSFMGKMRRFVNQMKEDSPLQDTVREVQDAMNLEEEKRHIENIGNDLETDLSQSKTDMDFDMDEFQRPFGGETQSTGGSQFNKAPSQPQRPVENNGEQTSSQPEKTETVAQATPDETPTKTAAVKESNSQSEETQKS